MRRLRENRLEAVVGRIYEAAVGPALWRTMLQGVADALGAESAALFGAPINSDHDITFSEGLDSLIDWGLRGGSEVHNPRPERAMRFRSSRKVVTEADLFSEWELKHIPFNVEMIDRLGYRWDAGGVFTEIDGTPHFFTAQRRTGQEGFGRPELDAMQALFPHLERAAQISSQLSRARADGMLDAFEQMACGSVLIDAQGRVIRMNARAEGMLGQALQLSGGCLVAADRVSNGNLQRLVAVAVAPKPNLERLPGTAGITVRRQVGRPLVVYAMPVPGSAGNIFRSARAILVLVDPDASRQAPQAILAPLFGLTPTETRLALALADGKDLKAIAEAHNVSLATARNQLAVLMGKTDTHRQAELVALMARLALLPEGNGENK